MSPIVAGAMQEYDRPTQLGLKVDLFQSNKDAILLPYEVGVCQFPTPQPGPAFDVCFAGADTYQPIIIARLLVKSWRRKAWTSHCTMAKARKEYHLGNRASIMWYQLGDIYPIMCYSSFLGFVSQWAESLRDPLHVLNFSRSNWSNNWSHTYINMHIHSNFNLKHIPIQHQCCHYLISQWTCCPLEVALWLWLLLGNRLHASIQSHTMVGGSNPPRSVYWFH